MWSFPVKSSVNTGKCVNCIPVNTEICLRVLYWLEKEFLSIGSWGSWVWIQLLACNNLRPFSQRLPWVSAKKSQRLQVCDFLSQQETQADNKKSCSNQKSHEIKKSFAFEQFFPPAFPSFGSPVFSLSTSSNSTTSCYFFFVYCCSTCFRFPADRCWSNTARILAEKNGSMRARRARFHRRGFEFRQIVASGIWRKKNYPPTKIFELQQKTSLVDSIEKKFPCWFL